MNNENLSREEAAERSALISVDSYDVHVDLTNAKDPEFESYPTATTVRFSCNTPGAETFIDYIHHSIDSIKLNGVELKLDEVVDGARIRLANLKADNVLTIHGRSYYSRSGEGLHRYFDPSDGRVYLYTQYEPSDCRRVFPNFEQPDLKAVFNFRITAPKDWVVSSNAVLESQVTDPSDDSISKRVFAPTAKISTYITAILAGEYFTATTTYKPKSKVNSGDIPLVAYCRQSLKPHFDYDHIFKVTENGLDFFQDLFDYPYPYPKYEQAFVPEYNIGAMENPGLVTFTEDYIFVSGATEDDLEGRTNTICHEMAHMWFGDLVTMKWWNDLWLNESFAEFTSTLATAEATEWKDAWATFTSGEKSWGQAEDEKPTTHPITGEINDIHDTEVAFDGITYAKGASVLKQLVAYAGRKEFFQGIHNYLQKHQYSNATLNDLLIELEATSGRDMKAWSNLWLEKSGINTIAACVEENEDGTIKELALPQTAPAKNPVLRPHRLAIGFYNTDENGKVVRTDRIELDVDGERTIVAEAAGKKRPDLILINDDDLTYTKIRLDGKSLSFALRYMDRLVDSLPRAIIFLSLWDMVRNAELPAESFISTMLKALVTEHESTTFRKILGTIATARLFYVAPARRSQVTERVAGEIWHLAQAAAAGSDEQFQLLTSYLSMAAGPEFARRAVGFLDGSLVLPGLEIDNDLRWSIIFAQAKVGAIDTAGIEAELDKKDTTENREHAYFAKAAIPTAEAKAWAFDQALHNDQLTNSQLEAVANGFGVNANNPELYAGYVSRFFDSIDWIWDHKTFHMSEGLICPLNGYGLYPVFAHAADLVQAGQAWLESHPEAPKALRGMVQQNLDGSERVLRVQKYNEEIQENQD